MLQQGRRLNHDEASEKVCIDAFDRDEDAEKFAGYGHGYCEVGDLF